MRLHFSLVMFTGIGLALSLIGCASQAPKPSTSEPAVQQPVVKGSVAQEPAVKDETWTFTNPVPTTEVPVPSEIEDQLFSGDPKGEDKLYAETFIVDGDQTRLLIRGSGQFLCSPTGNCPYWIFRKTPDGYTQEIKGSAQVVSVKRGKSKSPELLSSQHGSATDSWLRLYKFDGTAYRLTKCMDQNYSDPNDIARTLDKPILTEIPATNCN